MTTTTLNQWLKRLKEKKALSKSEIQALNKSANSIRYMNYKMYPETQIKVINAQTLLNQTWYGRCEFKITKEQSAMGIDYLRRRYFKLDGTLRSRANGVIGHREVQIIKNFKRFTFVGIRDNDNGNYAQYCVVYRVYSKSGEHFDYSPMHWGEIQVIY